MHRLKWSVLCACLAAFFIALSAAAAELQPPLYVSGASPKRLLQTFDTLVTTFLKDTSLADHYPPGAAPDLARQLKIPSLLDNDDARISVAFDMDERFQPRWAFVLVKVDFADLCAQLNDAAFPTIVSGETATVGLDPVYPGKTVHLRRLPNSFILGSIDEEHVEDFAERFRSGVPLHPYGTDLYVLICPAVLRQRFPAQLDLAREMLAREATMQEFAVTAPPFFDDSLRRAWATTLHTYSKGLFERLLELNAASTTVTLDDGALILKGSIFPAPIGAWTTLANRYSEAEESEYRLAEAVPDDAIFFSAETDPDEGMFPGGVAFNALFDFVGNMLMFGDLHSDIDKIRADLTKSGMRERIKAFRLSPEGPRYVEIASLNDGRKYAADWEKLAEMCNAIAATETAGDIIARHMLGGENLFRVERGTVGPAAYRRVSLAVGNQTNKPAPSTSVESQVKQGFGSLLGGQGQRQTQTDSDSGQSGFSVLMGANRSSFVALSGKNIPAAELLEQIERTQNPPSAPLVVSDAAKTLLPKLKPRQMAHGIMKPTGMVAALFTAIITETVPERLAEAQAIMRTAGELAGWSLGVRGKEIQATAIIPLSVVNDLAVTATRLDEAGLINPARYSRRGAGIQPPTAPPPIVDEDSDDWGWGDEEPAPPTRPTGESGAISDLRRKAQAGDASAQFDLGLAYANGKFGLSADATEAEKWYRMAADQGNYTAMNNLGVLLIEDLDRPEEGFKWVLQAAEQGYVRSMRVAGIYYREGTGVAKNIPEAIRWLQLAVDKGDGSACLNLGLLYTDGDDGVAKDLVKAMEYYRKGDELGSAPCTRNMGVLIETGIDGVPADPARALALYIRAGNAGDPTAMYYAGLNYRDGLGTEKNLRRAMHWFLCAADSGYSKAREELTKLPAGTVPEAEPASAGAL